MPIDKRQEIEAFEVLLTIKAEKMAKASTWRDQAKGLGVEGDDQLKAFKLGGWDAMIYDMAHALDIDVRRYADRKFRKQLIEKWLKDGL